MLCLAWDQASFQCCQSTFVRFNQAKSFLDTTLWHGEESRAVHWRQQKRATVDDGINEELDVNNVVVAKGQVAAEGTSREDGVCFVDNVEDGVDKDNIVSSLRPSQFSQLLMWWRTMWEGWWSSQVHSKLRNWYLHKYVRCYEQRNQFCIDKQMVFLSASFWVIEDGINMIVARLVVVTSATVWTVHSQRWNCQLRIEAIFLKLLCLPLFTTSIWDCIFCLHALESICAKIVSPRSLHQPKPKIRDDGGAYLHLVTTKSLFHLNQSYLSCEIDCCGFARSMLQEPQSNQGPRCYPSILYLPITYKLKTS